MSLCCFFGVELKVGEEPQCPLIPPQSTLMITNVAVAAANTTGGRVTLYAKGMKSKDGVALCTLHPDSNVFHAPLQVIFSDYVSLWIEGAKGAAPESLPSVHVTGYYEAVDEDEEEEEDEELEEAEDDPAPAKRRRTQN